MVSACIAVGQQPVMLKGRRQPGAAQVARIQGLGLIGAVAEFDGGDIEPLGAPGDQRYRLDRAAPHQRDRITRDGYPHDAGPVLDQAGRCIELLGRELSQLYITRLRLTRVTVPRATVAAGFTIPGDIDLQGMACPTLLGRRDIEEVNPAAVELMHQEPVRPKGGLRQQIDRSVDTLRAQQGLNGGRNPDLHRGREFNALFLPDGEFQSDRRFLPFNPLRRVGLGKNPGVYQQQRHAERSAQQRFESVDGQHGLRSLR